MARPFSELGVASNSNPSWGLRNDEFIRELKGTQGIKRYREMRENDPIVGAVLMAMDMMLRNVEWRVDGGTETGREFLRSVMDGMDDKSWSEFISEVLSFLPYGFHVAEKVYKRRPDDGNIGIKKLAPRAQWTIDRFEVTDKGDVLGVWQMATQRSTFIPYSKVLHFRTTAVNAEPAGRSVLRSAYTSWRYQNEIKYFEAVGIERELNGMPLFRIPSEFMSAEASDSQKAFFSSIQTIARDVKRNEQGYIVLPSDMQTDDDGKISGHRLVEFELVASKGTRDIDTRQVILAYQQDMARSVMADFVMLGSNDRGSFALSKSKSDLFLRALEGHMDTIANELNRKLIPDLWAMNGFDNASMPKLTRGRVAPPDLEELGNFVQRMALSGMDLFPDDMLDKHIRDVAGLPDVDPNKPAPVAPEAAVIEEPSVDEEADV